VFYQNASREEIRQYLLQASARHLPATPQEDIDRKLEESLSGTEKADSEDAKELAVWFKEQYRVEVPEDVLANQTRDAIRQELWNRFDHAYRPEMRRMERNLLLEMIDSSWKSHLLGMDHLRSGIGLWSYAQVDPKTKYKQEGMKLFEGMLEALDERVCETIFRVEEAPEEAMSEALWAGAQATHTSVQQSTDHQPGHEQEGGTDPQSGRQSGPQRPLPLRQRQEVQELPHANERTDVGEMNSR
jgi:preprotein translocase subunit SecA